MRDVPTFHVACIKKLGRTVYVAPGNGDGTFQPQSAVATGFDHPYATAVADLNRDGSLDLAIANTSNVNCAGSSVVLPTSNVAPVSDWWRMRRAIASPLSSMRPGFKPLRPQYFLSALSRFKRIVRLLIWRPQSRGCQPLGDMVGCIGLPCPALHACTFAATQGKGFGLCSNLVDPFRDPLFQ